MATRQLYVLTLSLLRFLYHWYLPSSWCYLCQYWIDTWYRLLCIPPSTSICHCGILELPLGRAASLRILLALIRTSALCRLTGGVLCTSTCDIDKDERWMSIHVHGSSAFVSQDTMNNLSLYSIKWLLHVHNIQTLSSCLVSTPAQHPDNIGNQEPQLSNPHLCSKHTQI